MTTVEEILAARPDSLRKRAIAAHNLKLQEDAERIKVEQDELEIDVYDFLREKLLLSAAEIIDVELQREKFNADRALLVWTIDKLNFRARYGQEKVMEKKSSEFGDEIIYKPFLIVEVKPKTAWTQIDSLTELGSKLR